MSNAHIPGPYKVRHVKTEQVDRLLSKDFLTVSHTFTVWTDERHEYNNTNVRETAELLAAAPEVQRALIDILESGQLANVDPLLIENARAALGEKF